MHGAAWSIHISCGAKAKKNGTSFEGKKKISWPGSSPTHYNVLTFQQQLFPKWQRKNSALQLLTKFDFLQVVSQNPPRTIFFPKPMPQFS